MKQDAAAHEGRGSKSLAHARSASAGPSRTAPSPRLKRAWRLTRRVDLKDGSERLPQDAAAQRDEVVSKVRGWSHLIRARQACSPSRRARRE